MSQNATLTLNSSSGTSNSPYNLVCGQNSNINNYNQNWLGITDVWAKPIDYSKMVPTTITTSTSTGVLTFNNNNIMQNKVAVFKVTRDENQKIISTSFLKEMWIESKNGSSIDFEVAKDPEISKYKADEIVIRNVYTITF